jgi:predicted phosphodiesterase
MTDFPLAIIADIHSNSWALEAVLRDIQHRNVRQIVNLGDCLLGPLDPVGTADRLIDLNILTIQGNDDRVLLSPPEHPSAATTFTLEHLEAKHLEWVRTFPATAVVANEIFLFHGDLSADETYLLEKVTPDGVFLRGTISIAAALENIDQPVILCGHSHLPRTIFLPSGKLIVNPGSVGMPAYTSDLPLPHGMESGSPHAKYAVLSKAENGWQVEHVLVPYNWERAASVARDNGRSDWAKWIATGRV